VRRARPPPLELAQARRDRQARARIAGSRPPIMPMTTAMISPARDEFGSDLKLNTTWVKFCPEGRHRTDR